MQLREHLAALASNARVIQDNADHFTLAGSVRPHADALLHSANHAAATGHFDAAAWWIARAAHEAGLTDQQRDLAVRGVTVIAGGKQAAAA
jgi:hypothetical protein